MPCPWWIAGGFAIEVAAGDCLSRGPRRKRRRPAAEILIKFHGTIRTRTGSSEPGTGNLGKAGNPKGGASKVIPSAPIPDPRHGQPNGTVGQARYRPGPAESLRGPGRRSPDDRRNAHPARHRAGQPRTAGGLRHDRQGQRAGPVPAAQEAALGTHPRRVARDQGPRPPGPPHDQSGAGPVLDRVRRRRPGRAAAPHGHEEREEDRSGPETRRA